MASITKSTYLGTGSDEVWEVLRDPGRANELITLLGEVTVDGNTRVCALGDDVLEELVVDIDDVARRFVYSIRRSPLGFVHHSASMQAIPEGEGILALPSNGTESAVGALDRLTPVLAA